LPLTAKSVRAKEWKAECIGDEGLWCGPGDAIRNLASISLLRDKLNKEEEREISARMGQCKGDDEVLGSDQGRVVRMLSSFWEWRGRARSKS
jgi:hypothetical protein